MELLLIRAHIKEDESKMTRFLHGLNDEISDFLEMFIQHFCKIFLIKPNIWKGRGHIAAECPSRRTMLVNEMGEWKSASETKDDG
uniref:Uncharacterized protein n=1 Tax=Oryza sativa subsp. japonica TaxID=39947 RepID=Q68UR3_ORYSJ|nr:hypothetical protein [Oryza sativa Japonica Group]